MSDMFGTANRAEPITGRQLNIFTTTMIFLDFISSHRVQTHAVFAFVWIDANARECCTVRQCQALPFQQATVHSLRVTGRHVAAPRKYSVSQHGSQANVPQISMSSTTVSNLSMPVQKIFPQHTAMLQAHIQKYLKYVNASSWKSHKNMLTHSYENNYHIYPNISWGFFPQIIIEVLYILSQQMHLYIIKH
jgi:hypothetical protein